MDLIVGALDDRKAENIKVFDVRKKQIITDMIVVASATSSPHLKALSSFVQREVKNKNGGTARISGDSESAWIVLDYYDAIVHLFLPEAREYYDIESLWV